MWLLAVEAESYRVGDYRIRNVLERAIKDSSRHLSSLFCMYLLALPLTLFPYSNRRSALLWLKFLSHEAARYTPELKTFTQSSSARDAFYRAVRSCPWSKRVWLEGIEVLAKIFDVVELHDLLALISEKELRLKFEMPI